MNEELKQLEIELAKVRLAKEQLELRDALKRAQRQQAISDKTEKVVAVGRNAALVWNQVFGTFYAEFNTDGGGNFKTVAR